MRRRISRAQRDNGAFETRYSDYRNEVPEQEGPPLPPEIAAARAAAYWDGILGEPYPWETFK